jgi:mRNA interferase MazF
MVGSRSPAITRRGTTNTHQAGERSWSQQYTVDGVRRGEVWLIKGARERLGLIVSSDVFNGTDVPVVIVAEVIDAEELRDSPLAVELDDLVVMPDRLSSPLKRWFTERVAVADTSTMHNVSRALRILQDL